MNTKDSRAGGEFAKTLMLGSDVCRAKGRRMASTWFQEARTEGG
jgi:hypothetical protein